MIINKNRSIQVIRIVAMFMIIFDHILCKISFPMQAMIVQVMNSGVFIFLLISGFLFGNKEIKNWKIWFINRLTRICIPLWIFMIIDFIVEAIIWKTFEFKYVFIYAFNLQGILGINTGGTNLWFLTLIMICYLITPVLQWIKKKTLGKYVGISAAIIGIIVQIILAYTTDIGMVAGHTLSWCVIAIGMYVVGYFVGNTILSDNIGKTRIGTITVLMIISCILVLIFNHKFDGQVIYDRIIIYYGMVVVDTWICTVLYKLGQFVKEGIIKKIINHFDRISYEFYIVHGLIIVALTQLLIGNVGVIAYIFATIVLSYIFAWILHLICKLIYMKTRQ